MRTPVLLTLGELGLGLLVGFITFRLSGETDTVTGILSIAVGLLTSLLAATFAQHFHEEANQQRIADRLDYLVHQVSDRMLSSADAAAALRFGGVEVARSEVTRVWLDRLWRTSSRYWGVIYTAPGEVVDTNVFQLGLAVLSAKVRVDQVDVRRILLVDDKEELEHLLPVMRAQHDNNIAVRYLLRESVTAHPLLNQQVKQLSTLDFSVMDRDVVWLLLLDGHRRIQAGALHFDQAMNERYSEVYRLMWDAAVPLNAALAT